MTNLEALKATIEYSNENLFTKVLLDRDVNPSETYTAANKQSIDLALTDVLLYLASHPEMTEGNLSLKYSPSSCRKMRQEILKSYGLSTNTSINGSAIW